MNDYLDLFNSHDANMERKYEEYVDERPKCECCGEPIMDDFAICIDDEWFCDSLFCKESAMEALWEKHSDNYKTSVA
jgi:formylmethanofuran dehydrogenase subunit E